MTWRIIKPRKLEKFPRATSRKVQWRPGLVRRVLVKRILWISVRRDGELKVRSSLYIAKPCRYQEICLSSNLVSTYYWQLSIVFYLFCRIWPAPRQDIRSFDLMSCEARMLLSERHKSRACLRLVMTGQTPIQTHLSFNATHAFVWKLFFHSGCIRMVLVWTHLI